MCDCIRMTNEALQDRGLELDVMWFISNPIKTVIPVYTLLKEKRRGQKAIKISANFCPFCGEKYPTKLELIP